MLDDRTRMMLEVANQLTANDIEFLKSGSPIVPNRDETVATLAEPRPQSTCPVGADSATSSSRGAYERQRTRESKTSTTCVGNERTRRDWWPIGTELVAHIGGEEFTGEVVENSRVKSGRSILITPARHRARSASRPRERRLKPPSSIARPTISVAAVALRMVGRSGSQNRMVSENTGTARPVLEAALTIMLPEED